MRDKADFSPRPADLLTWYEANARDMPWRVSPAARTAGARPDAYAVWLSEVMLQQTTVAAVRGYFERFMARWPDVAALAAADDGDVMAEWAGLGYYARARNLLKCARVVVADHGGRFPDTRAQLQALPGIGPYTAAAIAAIAFDRPEVVVDGNVERVMARLHDHREALPGAKRALTEIAAALTPEAQPGDYAQAVMDLGATICTPKSPACGICPWWAACKARAAGSAADLPVKTPKKAKPVRYGHAYVAKRCDGAWLLERRPGRGLLGGMLGWPGSEWTEVQAPCTAPPVPAPWRAVTGEARHTFTHFHLRLRIYVADLPLDADPGAGVFIPAQGFRPSDLPTAMRKVFDLAQDEFDAAG